jgi:magnesium-transporting ATPase (P-type)
VPGDIFVVGAGDSVPTDARIIEASTLSVAEAALTGESLPVTKQSPPISEEAPLADRSNMIYAGTYVTSGRALAIAVSTGAKNEIGRIATLATTTAQPKTQLELRVQKFGSQIVVAALVLFCILMGLGIWRGIHLAEIFMISVSQVVSLVPEGLPVALTIALAVGVQRMAKRRTVVRRLTAVESLGATTVICTDKTGTLTKNEMTVVEVYIPSSMQFYDVTGVGYKPTGKFISRQNGFALTREQIRSDRDLYSFFCAIVNCNDAQLVRSASLKTSDNWSILGDPTEAALLSLAEKVGLSVERLRELNRRRSEIQFDSNVKIMATKHESSEFGGRCVIYLKGAPEALLSLSVLSQVDQQACEVVAQSMAEKALRVLAVGEIVSEFDLQNGFSAMRGQVRILGLLGQMDPPREEVPQAVRECFAAGIRPVMITGDHKATGVAVARALGISQKDDMAIGGQELERLSESQLLEKIERVSVFARVYPEQKLRIVQALQKLGHVVTMTGDGVNDAPALVKADIGVAMGITGTEVAKEAAKIVITDDNFSTVVAAVSEGRLIYQNIKKLILFLFVTSIDEVVILFLALICGYPPPLEAVQILWINLVSEVALTANLIMEPPEGDEMKRAPTSTHEPLIDRRMLNRMPLMVVASVFSTFGWFVYRTYQGVDPALVQSETFTVLVVCQWFNVLNCRSYTQTVFSWSLIKNLWLVGGLIIANLLHVLVIYWAPLAQFFHTQAIQLHQVFAIGLVASLVLWAEEVRKFFVRRSMLTEFNLNQ